MMSGLANATPPDDAFETANAAIKKLFDGDDFGYHYAMFIQDPAVEAEEPKNYEMPMHGITLMKFSGLSGVTPSPKNSSIWKNTRCGKKLKTRTFLPEGVALNTNGCGTLREMMFFVRAW
jgi:hypothetical protein